MNYKNFNLNDALAGKPVITRDGRPVKIAGYDEDALPHNTLVGWIGKDAVYWNNSGKHVQYEAHDLFMAPTERKEYIVRADYGSCAFFQGPYDAKNQAMEAVIGFQKQNYTASVHEITIIE